MDVKSKKMFLKKSPCPAEIDASDFVLGAKLFLYARELTIIDYGDGTTRGFLHHQLQKCVAVFTSESIQDWLLPPVIIIYLSLFALLFTTNILLHQGIANLKTRSSDDACQGKDSYNI